VRRRSCHHSIPTSLLSPSTSVGHVEYTRWLKVDSEAAPPLDLHFGFGGVNVAFSIGGDCFVAAVWGTAAGCALGGRLSLPGDVFMGL
jgi:hypothetical protein